MVPYAAPIVPSLGMKDVEDDREDGHRRAETQRGLGIASGTKGAAEHEEHHHPEDAGEHGAQERERLMLNLGRGFDEIEQRRRGEIADHSHDG